MADIPVTALTESTITGKGVFDELMKATKAHLEQEFAKGRIKGPEYSTVYLGSLQSVMQYSIQFLLERQRADKQAELLDAQVDTERKQQDLLGQQLLNSQAEEDLLRKQALKVVAETTLVNEQVLLTKEQILNAKRENELMVSQICKLKAEFDVLVETKIKTTSETALLTQKKRTEEAQTNGGVASTDSVIGRQNALYTAQSEGYKRDAEQKAAKILADAWSVQRTTDDGISANDTNLLNDANVGRAMAKLLSGVGA